MKKRHRKRQGRLGNPKIGHHGQNELKIVTSVLSLNDENIKNEK